MPEPSRRRQNGGMGGNAGHTKSIKKDLIPSIQPMRLIRMTTVDPGSVYRFIGVWQQDIAKDHSERTV